MDVEIHPVPESSCEPDLNEITVHETQFGPFPEISPPVSESDPVPETNLSPDELVNIHSVTGDFSRLVLRGEISGDSKAYLFDMLVDTGATASLVSDKVVSLLSADYEIRPSKIRALKGVGPNLVGVSEEIVLSVLFSNNFVCEPVPFLITPHEFCSHAFLLGADFLSLNRFLPDVDQKTLLVKSEGTYSVVARDPSLMESVSLVCSASDFIELESNSWTLVPVVLNLDGFPEFPTNIAAEFIPEKSLKVDISPGILNLCSDVQYVPVFNYSHRCQHIHKGQMLGITTFLPSAPVEVAQMKAFSEVAPVSVPDPAWTETSLSEVFRLSDSALTSEEKSTLISVLSKFPDVISHGDHDVGTTTAVQHHIELTDSRPVALPVRRLAPQVLKEVDDACHELENSGIIRSSCSPFSAPIVPVRKPDGTLRLCIDYRELNKVTKKDKFPIPNLTDLIYSLKGIRCFSSIDLVRGYYQVLMADDSIERTAFSTPHAHYEFVRMPFGVTNGPATFQRGMVIALSGIPTSRAIIYLHDILVLGKDFSDHLISLELVLSALNKYGFKLKPSKTSLCQSEVQFLGHIVSEKGILPLPRNLSGIQEFPVPTSIRQVRSFLGMVNFYRRFLPRCAEISKPLSEITGQRSLNWTTTCQHAFEQLKDKLLSPDILTYPDYSDEAPPLELRVDASDFGAGAVLSQVQDGVSRPIAFVSYAFTETEKRYSTTERELAALRWAVKSLRVFLYGRKFFLFTDHRPLIYLHNMKLESPRLARTLEDLSEFEYELRYTPGSTNIVADALSRNPVGEVVSTDPGSSENPPEGFIVQEIPGGGDSLFMCMSTCKYGNGLRHPEIREILYTEILTHPKKYGYDRKSATLKKLRLLKRPGYLPDESICSIASELWNTNILL